MNEENKVVTIDAYVDREAVGTARSKNTVTVNLDHVSLFQNKFSTNEKVFRILIGNSWYFISEDTYDFCIAIMGPRQGSF